MRRYELMLLFQPDLEDDQLQAAVERVTRAIVNAGGQPVEDLAVGQAAGVSHPAPPGRVVLPHPFRHRAVRGPEIERGLLISEEILRHLVVVLEPRHRRAGEEAADGAVVEAEETSASASCR